MGEAQADITLLSQDLDILSVLTMTTFPDRDPVLFEGTLSNLVRDTVIDVAVEIPQSAISVLSLSEFENALTLNDDEGNGTDYAVSSYSVNSALDGRYEIHGGVFTDPDGNSFDLIASTDPVDKIVLILAIAAVACLAVITVQALIDDCKASMQSNMQACANAGGLPALRVNVIFGFGRDESGSWRVGCSHSCSVECRSR